MNYVLGDFLIEWDGKNVHTSIQWNAGIVPDPWQYAQILTRKGMAAAAGGES